MASGPISSDVGANTALSDEELARKLQAEAEQGRQSRVRFEDEAHDSDEALARKLQAEETGVESAGPVRPGELVLGFRLPNDSVRSIAFGNKKPPLGMDFTMTSPVTVRRVTPGGYAADLGVQQGWSLASINGDNVESMAATETFSKLSKAAGASTDTRSEPEGRPGPPLASRPAATGAADIGMVLGFRLPDGSVRNIAFGDRKPPLGMEFEKETPVSVKNVRPGGHAEELGVGTKWIVVSVDGESVEGKDFPEVFALMKKASASANGKK